MAESSTVQQMELVSVLKVQLDLVYKKLNYFRGICKSVDRLNRAVVRLHSDIDSQAKLLAEFVKFERIYRVLKKRFRKLDNKLLNVNLYDKIYDLFECLKTQESDSRVADSINDIAISSSVDSSKEITELRTLNISANNSQPSVSARVTRQQKQKISLTVLGNLAKNQATQTINSVVSERLKAKCTKKNKTKLRKLSMKSIRARRKCVELSDSIKEKVPKLLSCEAEGCRYTTTVSSSMINHKVVHSDDRPFRCDQCEATFKMKGLLKAHRNSVHEKKRYECKDGCQDSYPTMRQLRRHIKIVHTKEVPLLYCSSEGCDYSTYDKGCLKTHQLVHMSGEHRFRCSFEGCEYSTNRVGSLRMHRHIHAAERPFKCAHCDQSYKSASSLSVHKRIHDNEPRFKCDWEGCGYSTYRSQSLKHHLTIHTGERPANAKVFSCYLEGCQYFTVNSSSMKRHKASHSNERPFKCDLCDKTYKFKGDLKDHLDVHAGKRFECTVEGCTASYSAKKDIKTHIKIVHTNEAPVLHCDWEGCQYSTNRSQCFKSHRISHTGERPFKCPHCEQAYKSASNLSVHKRVHEKEPRFRCSVEGCAYSTYRSNGLRIHLLSHNDERTFKCIWPGCDQAFKSAPTLHHHKMVHQTELRYKCSFEGCEYSTHRTDSLYKHQVVHSDDRPYSCPYCDQSFKLSTTLWKHKLKHTKNQGQLTSTDQSNQSENLQT